MLRDGIPKGQRNNSLASLTGHLLRRWIDVDVVVELVHLVNGGGAVRRKSAARLTVRSIRLRALKCGVCKGGPDERPRRAKSRACATKCGPQRQR